MLKISLIQTPFIQPRIPPTALALLKSCLRKAGYEVHCFDINVILFNNSSLANKQRWGVPFLWGNRKWIYKFLLSQEILIKDFVNQVREMNIDIVGFSIYVSTILVSLEIAHRIREKLPSIKIIFGGPYFNREEEALRLLKRTDLIDAIVMGEGEITLAKLVSIIEQKGEVDFCRGTIIKNKDRVINCGRRKAIKNLNSLPFLDYSDFPLFSYKPNFTRTKSLVSRGPMVGIVGSRGCINSCAFCVESIYYLPYRIMDAKRVFAEFLFQLSVLKDFQRKNKPSFYFTDSLINGDIKILSELCDIINNNKLDISWIGQAVIRPEMDAELLKKMRLAGCKLISYGLESGSQRVLAKMGKCFNIKQAEEVIKKTYQAGIITRVSIIVGFPTETDRDFEKTIDFIKRNKIYISKVSSKSCIVFPGSRLNKYPRDFNIFPKEQDIFFWKTSDGRNNFFIRLKRWKIMQGLINRLHLQDDSIFSCDYGDYEIKDYKN